MADYGALDAHSRNCSACRRQREAEGGRKRLSLQESDGCLGKKVSSTSPGEAMVSTRVPGVKRSNSTLSCTSEVRKEEGGEGSIATYLTPTQRRNQEVKRIRLELGRANHRLEEKEREIGLLRRELVALKESGRMEESWGAETGSVTDSGNCEEDDGGGHIDFELMEGALREEEETRQRLEEENSELREELEQAREEQQASRRVGEETQRRRDDELRRLQQTQEEQELEGRRERSQREAELVRELAESSLRCARQQEVIEHKQAKEEELRRQLEEINKKMQEQIHRLGNEERLREELRQSQSELELLKKKEEGEDALRKHLEQSKAEAESLRVELMQSKCEVQVLRDGVVGGKIGVDGQEDLDQRRPVEELREELLQSKAQAELLPVVNENLKDKLELCLEERQKQEKEEDLNNQIQELSEQLKLCEAQLKSQGEGSDLRQEERERMGSQLVEEKEKLREQMLKQLALQKQRLVDEMLNDLEEQRTKQTKDLPKNQSVPLKLNKTDLEYLKTKKYGTESSSQTEAIDMKRCSCQNNEQTSNNSDTKLEDISLSEDRGGPEDKVHFTFQFLRRSIFYFLTDLQNSSYHLRSIERLLEFSDGERGVIDRVRGGKKNLQPAPTPRY